MGSIWQSFHFIVLGKGVWTFRFRSGNPPFWNLENVLSPKGTLQSRARNGSKCFYLCFIGIGNDTGGFNFSSGHPHFWNLENVLSPNGTAIAEPNGVHLILSILLCLRKGVWTFRFRDGIPPFWILENVLTQWGPFDSLSILLGLGNVYWTSRFRGGNPPFWNPENVLSPKGLCEAQPKGVHLTVFPFYCCLGKGV